MTTPAFDYSASRGKEIASVESNIRRIDEHEYRVKSQSGNGEYAVIQTELGWNCSCPDFAFRGVKCKHAIAVELSLQIRRPIENAKRVGLWIISRASHAARKRSGRTVSFATRAAKSRGISARDAGRGSPRTSASRG